MRLKDKVAFITGSGQFKGIGLGIARCLAEDGADLVIHYRSKEEEAHAVAEELRSTGNRVLLLQADLSKAEEIKPMFDQIKREFGKLDIMVNNAGTCVWEPVLEITQEGFNQIVNVNLRATFLCSHYAAKIMVDQGVKGRIINISSLNAKRPSLTMGIYSASKAGMDHMTQSMALELAPYGITVNQVMPGWVDTNINSSKPEQQTEEGKKALMQTIPLGQAATPWDVGKGVAYLAGKEGQAVTGAFIKVDGGAFIKSL